MCLQPFAEGITYLVDFGVGGLDGFAVAHFGFPAVHHHFFGHIGCGVYHRVLQQGDAVESPAFGTGGVFGPDVHVFSWTTYGKIVQGFDVADIDIGVKQIARETAVNFRRYPPLAEVEIQFFKFDALRKSVLQSFQRKGTFRVVGMIFQVFFYRSGFFHDIARDEFVGYFVFLF